MPENRLAREASPYLLQHAHNPVDWYPWGEEALAAAKRDDKPILLSIGYSACHWCHVMEKESFENDAIAKLMNEWFVNVKVDREERPDLDHIYQMTVQLMGRSGGWPLTVFLTPDQKPFFAGTYFPPVDRYGVPGFPKILQAVWEAYRARREDVAAQADELSEAIAKVGAGEREGAPYAPGPDLLARASQRLSSRFDDTHGGFGSRPKFPNTMPLEVLFRRGVVENDPHAKERALHALDAMRAGGIYDQLGFGFHRYSTDEEWLVPHFEKMLYDNALLVRAYADAFRATNDERHARVVREVFAYVAREMTDANGAFFASQDADSEGEEGKFFVWDERELRGALAGDEDALRAAIAGYGVTPRGNFEESGKTVLHVARSPEELAVDLGMPRARADAALERARAKLFAAREARPKPFRDEKILASWNALMIAALADAGGALGDASMIAASERAFAYVEAKLTVKSGEERRVLRLAKGELAKGPGFLDDHAYVADAALDLYEVTGDARYVRIAREIAEAILGHFWDGGAEGGFYFVPDDGEKLICRAKDPYDHAIPSGGSIACRALLRLGALCEPPFAEYAAKELERLAPMAIENPFGMGQAICVLDRLIRGSVDVVIVGPRADARTRALAAAALRAYLPNRTVAWSDPGDPASRAACAVLGEGKAARDEPVAYVCRGRTCSLPVASPEELARLLAP